jgi:hypothetical protein
VEQEQKRREVVYFQYTCHGKRWGIERRDTQKNTSAQTTCRVPRPRCTKCTKTSLGSLVVWLSPQEPKRRYGLEGTSMQGFSTTTKRRVKTQDSPSFDPHAIATTGIEGTESKEQQTPNKQGTEPTSFWIDRNREQRKRERRMESVLLRPTHHRMGEGWKEGDTIL